LIFNNKSVLSQKPYVVVSLNKSPCLPKLLKICFSGMLCKKRGKDMNIDETLIAWLMFYHRNNKNLKSKCPSKVVFFNKSCCLWKLWEICSCRILCKKTGKGMNIDENAYHMIDVYRRNNKNPMSQCPSKVVTFNKSHCLWKLWEICSSQMLCEKTGKGMNIDENAYCIIDILSQEQ